MSFKNFKGAIVQELSNLSELLLSLSTRESSFWRISPQNQEFISFVSQMFEHKRRILEGEAQNN